MYTLYYSPGTASMIIHLALIESQARYELKLLNLEQGEQKSSAYLALNPQGTVPTLIVDQHAYSETPALLMLLAERHAGLAPALGSHAHQLWRQWLFDLSHNLQSSFRIWFYPPDLGYVEYPQELRDAIQVKIAKIWDRLDAHLAEQGPYLLGTEFSVADLYLCVLMRWSRNMPRPATTWPALCQFAQTITARQSWRTMMEIEAIDTWPPT